MPEKTLVFVRVWDLPTRIFHWVLALAVVGLLISGNIGNQALVWHFRCGYLVLALLLFRLVWGIVGGHWSRFRNFVTSPAKSVAYWKHIADDALAHRTSAGHNPMGAWSVLAMLFFLAAQVLSGLCADDEIAYAGPLAKHLSEAMVHRATFYHSNVGRWIVLALVLMHLAAIAFYYFKKRQNLIGPMVLGDKLLAPGTAASKDHAGTRFVASLVFAVCAGLVAWIVRSSA